MNMNLSPYLTDPGSSVFCLKNLPEEVIAVLFAKYSRSPDSLPKMLGKMLDDGDIVPEPDWNDHHSLGVELDDWLTFHQGATTEKARAFHEKFVVGYGHASVAEHAVLHYGVEGISMLAAKGIEDGRLASYTEKSTRYVDFGQDSYAVPEEIRANQELLDRYHALMGDLFQAYRGWFPEIQEEFRQVRPDAKPHTLRGRTCDVLRYLLPTSTRTNLGITVNARQAAHMIRKLRSSQLDEFRVLGDQLLGEGRKVSPTLLKHCEPGASKPDLAIAIGQIANDVDELWSEASDHQLKPCRVDAVDLCDLSRDLEREIATTLLFEEGHLPRLRQTREALDANDQLITTVYEAIREHRGDRDPLPRAFEHGEVTVEMCVDFGAWRDIQRHRMSSQLLRPLGPTVGYSVPNELRPDIYAGIEPKPRQTNFSTVERLRRYHSLMGQAESLYWEVYRWTDSKLVAQYCLPMAYQQQVLVRWNLRALAHFIELRSGRQGHPSYRRVAQQLHRQLQHHYPRLAACIRCDHDSYDWARE